MVKGKILGEAILYDLYGAKLVQQLALKVGKKVETSSINLVGYQNLEEMACSDNFLIFSTIGRGICQHGDVHLCKLIKPLLYRMDVTLKQLPLNLCSWNLPK